MSTDMEVGGEFEATTMDVLPDGTVIEIDEYRSTFRKMKNKN